MTPRFRPILSTLVTSALLCTLACGESQLTPSTPIVPAPAPAVSAAPTVTPPSPVPTAGAAAVPTVAPVGNPIAQNGPAAGSGGTGGGGAAGGGGSASHMHDDCVEPTPAALEDAMLTSDAPDTWMSPRGSIDLVLPKPVQSWMNARLFKEGHDGWHAVRRCNFVRRGSGVMLSPAFALCEKPELKPAEQECAGKQDGYEFLVVHRHMINVLRQAFPKHPQLFAGFPKFPFDAKDVPEQFRERFGNGWSSQITKDATTLEDIENNLSRFPTEGDLGQFIQCGMGSMGASSVHGALHFKWTVNGSPYVLGDTTANLGNYMFWKLHAWIDDIWTRYRKAKGLRDDDPMHVAALLGQCREMHTVGGLIGPIDPMMTGSTVPLPQESGMFHEQVRPILEDNCAGCHSGGSPEAGMVLGGQVSSATIVSNLVGVQDTRGGQFKRVVANNPMQSWLYLKAAGMAASAGCTGMCNNQVMPPTGMVTLSAAQLGTIERWIMEGAAAPSKP